VIPPSILISLIRFDHNHGPVLSLLLTVLLALQAKKENFSDKLVSIGNWLEETVGDASVTIEEYTQKMDELLASGKENVPELFKRLEDIEKEKEKAQQEAFVKVSSVWRSLSISLSLSLLGMLLGDSQRCRWLFSCSRREEEAQVEQTEA